MIFRRSCLPKERSMLNPQSMQLRVGVDVGAQRHHVAVGLTDGSLLDEFEVPHTAEGFGDFFARIEGHAKRHRFPIAVAMEGYNGHVRLLDSLVRARGWQLFNVNNLKLARFKETFRQRPRPIVSTRPPDTDNRFQPLSSDHREVDLSEWAEIR
jgi:hypothetical protein